MGLGPLKQEAGGERSWSIVFLWGSCSAEKKKKTSAVLGWFGEGEAASDPGRLCDVTGSGDMWVYHCAFHLWVSPGQLGKF